MPPLPEPLQVSAWQGASQLHLIQFVVEPGARADGKTLASLAVGKAQPLVILRGEQTLNDLSSVVMAGDHVAWLSSIVDKGSLATMCQTMTPLIQRFYGDFTVRVDIQLADLAEAYGITLPDPALAKLTLNTLFLRKINLPVVGDALHIGGLRLRVRSMDGERADQIGIRLPH